MQRRLQTLSLGVAILLTACHDRIAPVVPTLLAVDRTPVSLAEPGVFDWTTQRITSSVIAERRAAKDRRIQAFSATAPWSATTGRLLNATNFPGTPTIAANDYVPNGPAAVYGTSGTPASCFNTLFFLTRNGILIKVKKDGSGVQKVGLNTTFSRTYVTLSPAGGRAYLLADNGQLFMVNTDTMANPQLIANLGGSNQGLAPVLDPYTSNHADGFDDLYVPTSDGTVRRYHINPSATPVVSPVASYSIGGGLKSPPMVLGGEIFAGDQSGNFIRFSTATNAALSVTPLAYPVNAPIALEMDGSGNVIAAFVNAGMRCHWINFTDGSVASSLPLYLNENAGNPASGKLKDWKYGNPSTKYWVPPAEALSLNLDTAKPALPRVGTYKTANELTPAETNNTGTTTGTGKATGGAVDVFIRWNFRGTPLDNATNINPGMRLWMNVDNDATIAPVGEWPSTRRIMPYTVGQIKPDLRDAPGTLFTFANITQANWPNTAPTGGLNGAFGGTTGAHNRFDFVDNTYYNWLFNNPANWKFSSPDFAIRIDEDGGDEPIWPGGNGTPEKGNSPNKAQFAAPQWYWDATSALPNSYATATTVTTPPAGERRPLLEVIASAKALPTVSIGSPPVVDALDGRKRVYVFNGNAVFALDFTDAASWTDAAGDKTAYALTRLGIDNKPTFPASGTNAFNYVVENRTAPLMSFDGNSLYVLDRYPTAYQTAANPLSANEYTYGLNRIQLPADLATGNLTVADALKYTQRVGPQDASSHLVLDYFNYDPSGSVHFALPGTSGNPGAVFRINP